MELADSGPGQVLAEIAAAGFWDSDVLPRSPGFMARPPLIDGHTSSVTNVAAE